MVCVENEVCDLHEFEISFASLRRSIECNHEKSDYLFLDNDLTYCALGK